MLFQKKYPYNSWLETSPLPKQMHFFAKLIPDSSSNAGVGGEGEGSGLETQLFTGKLSYEDPLTPSSPLEFSITLPGVSMVMFIFMLRLRLFVV